MNSIFKLSWWNTNYFLFSPLSLLTSFNQISALSFTIIEIAWGYFERTIFKVQIWLASHSTKIIKGVLFYAWSSKKKSWSNLIYIWYWQKDRNLMPLFHICNQNPLTAKQIMTMYAVVYFTKNRILYHYHKHICNGAHHQQVNHETQPIKIKNPN